MGRIALNTLMDRTSTHSSTFKPIPQAMSLAIDRELISERLYGFAAEPACNLIAGPPRYVSTANGECLAQDIEGANRLLDEYGVLDTDGDGIREYNGVPLQVTYQTTTNSIRQATQALIRDWWLQIGVDTVLVQHDGGVFFGGDPVVHKEASLRRFFADVQDVHGKLRCRPSAISFRSDVRPHPDKGQQFPLVQPRIRPPLCTTAPSPSRARTRRAYQAAQRPR